MNKTILKNFISLLIIISMVLSPTFVCCETIYDFSDEAQARFEETEKQQLNNYKPQKQVIKTEPQIQKKKNNQKKTVIQNTYKNILSSNQVLEGNIIYVNEGESFDVILQSSISSGSLSNNDNIAGILSEDWIYNKKVIAPKGSIVYGHALDCQKAGLFFSNGNMTITFDTIMLPNGEQLKLTANTVKIQAGGNRVAKTAIRTLTGALVGVAIGALYALASGGEITRGLAIGAGIGAGGGLISSATSQGDEAEIPAGTLINVRLTKPMSANIYSK